jgi:hypothetical protein
MDGLNRTPATKTLSAARRVRVTGAAALAAAVCASPVTSRAQPLQYETLEQLFGEAVTTSVTGTPQRQSDVPATMDIVTAAEIRRSGAGSIPEVLQRVAGIDVMQWSRDHSDVAVRGYNQAFSPRLLVLVLLTVLFSDTWIADIYDGGILLALILAGTGWPYVWRSIRGPALQIAEEEWIDAARSFGQTPANIMRKHMASYVIGYLLIYFSMVLGGVIIAVAGLSFLGLGITAPTPEWGRAVNLGQEYIATTSWHISLIPGILITLIVMGFNAMGDATRDAIDPQSVNSEQAAGVVESRGGGA